MFRFLLYIFVLTASIQLVAQVPPGVNLSTINISSLSDEQFQSFVSRAQLSGLSEEELEAKAKAQGLTDAQIAEIRQRMAAGAGADKAMPQTAATSRKTEGSSATGSAPTPTKPAGSALYGKEIFSNQALSFEPNLRIATPHNYVLGPGDELVIEVYGYSERTFKQKINVEGNIRIPNIEPLRLSGMSIEDARNHITAKLKRIYPGIATGKTFVNVSLGDIRTIRVLLIGRVEKPGSYSLSSLSTIMNALYASGGPSAEGSFRHIELIRNGKTIMNFDLYDFLLKGDLRKNCLLQEDDVVKVGVYKKRITIAGAVKTPAIFECGDKENLQQIIDTYAGGFSDGANKRGVTVTRIGSLEKQLIHVPYDSLIYFLPQSADIISVGGILDKFSNRIQINGGVYFPGEYALESYPTLKKLLDAALPVENLFTSRGLLYREQKDGEKIVMAFNPQDILSGKASIVLQRNDAVQLFEKQSLRAAQNISITGEVNKPGSFPFVEGLLLEDLLVMAGGLTDKGLLQEIEISRRLRTDRSLTDTLVYGIIFKQTISHAQLAPQQAGFVLEPFDVVSIKAAPRNRNGGSVTIKGQVLFPGTYQLTNRKEQLHDIVQRAGGLLVDADIASATFLRKTFATNTPEELKNIKRSIVFNKQADSVKIDNLIAQMEGNSQILAISILQALTDTSSDHNIVVEDGDNIIIPQKPETVQVFGAVQLSKKMRYEKGLSYKAIIAEAGGYAENANKKKSYVLYPNGTVQKMSKFLFFKSYPRIVAGAEIYVPAKKERNKTSTAEYMTIFSGIIATATLVFAIINASK